MAKKKPAGEYTWDDLWKCIEEVLTNLRDAQSDIKAKEKGMIDTYLAEADEHLHKAIKVCSAITQRAPRKTK